ncbi:MAG: DUF3604 domain-containing protein [Pseudomonadota bacterium]
MTLEREPKPVPFDIVGTSRPSVRPGDDPRIFGSATFEGPRMAEVRTFQTYRIRYRVGRLGLDDTGAIRVAFRMITDAGQPQCHDPKAPNYVSATCSGSGTINLRIGPEGQRPWVLTVTAQLNGGYLKEGEEIELIFGDTSRGSLGMLMQTFVEEGYELKVMADVQATGNYEPLTDQFAISVHPGPGAIWKAVLPSLRRVGEDFHLGLKCEDALGNPTNQATGRVRFETSMPVEGLPEEFDYAPVDRAMCFENLKLSEAGTLWIKVFVDDVLACEAGPLVISNGDVSGYWGDLHGQTGETIGVNSIESYFDFARNKSFLDVSAHQANDFQITPAFWQKINVLSAALNEPGRFTVFPGYEWSGNTAVGGDHNVFFADEGRPIYRCSHALLVDRSEIANDANTLTDLYAKLRNEDAVVYAHVGGRYADIHYDHDPDIETAVEMHSAWGSFEWILTDGFPLRRRVGVVCNSDGHKGRPGASYPGASRFGAYGGLTCFLTTSNDRKSIIEAQRSRHHFGTTGCRMYLDVTASFDAAAERFARNPIAGQDAVSEAVSDAMMGDIVRVQGDTAQVQIRVIAPAGVLRVELRDGPDVVHTYRPYGEQDLGDRVRILWSGAAYRGRGRDVAWNGRVQCDAASVGEISTINALNPETRIERRGSQSVVFSGVTTGNFLGFDAMLQNSQAGRLEITSNQGALGVDLGSVGVEPMTQDCGGLRKELSVQRLPNAALPREMTIEHAVSIKEQGDTPIWVCVTLEDGHQAWSSPTYLFRDDGQLPTS